MRCGPSNHGCGTNGRDGHKQCLIMGERGKAYDEGFSIVSHVWDTKTPLRATSLDKGIMQGVAKWLGVITLSGEWLFDRARELSVDHLRILSVVRSLCLTEIRQSLP